MASPHLHQRVPTAPVSLQTQPLQHSPNARAPSNHHRRRRPPPGPPPVPRLTLTYDCSTLLQLTTLEERLRTLRTSTLDGMARVRQSLTARSTDIQLQQNLTQRTQRVQDLQLRLMHLAERVQSARGLCDTRCDMLKARQSLLQSAQLQAQLEQSYLYDSRITLEQNRIIKDASQTMYEQNIAEYFARLQTIFPITTSPDAPAVHLICGLPAPIPPHLDIMPDENANASAGYICQLVYIVARYLEIPLRYPVKCLSSRSVIYNPCADMMRLNVMFPLYIAKSEREPFLESMHLLTQNVLQAALG
ncbi:hypothetical protein H4R34_004740 [Dimargaris verticillata]|uniref:UV radiation resistance protein and autophagy-related subunit 14-domain-containing protein n=1 Tax=Dimargaris verticillata TaxID=2761393 RepID=A0A9W8E7U0_9FUNG|nr:hypothetical protein H4R34_004740 [Dimargaris verticillata]